jgi:hypothetical protein
MRASPAAAVLLGLVLALFVAGRADACTVAVFNYYNVSLSMFTYDGGDGGCALAYDWYQVDAGGGTSRVEVAVEVGRAFVVPVLGGAAFPKPVAPTALASCTREPTRPDLAYCPARSFQT